MKDKKIYLYIIAICVCFSLYIIAEGNWNNQLDNCDECSDGSGWELPLYLGGAVLVYAAFKKQK